MEGLENRLGRMEALLRLSGVLSDEDISKTDLGELEKQLASRTAKDGSRSRRSSHRPSDDGRGASPESLRRDASTQDSALASPQSGASSPEGEKPVDKRNEDEVEELSDLMCSLVTNNTGETRYIGRWKDHTSQVPAVMRRDRN